jgi:membrane-associated phospholipid phosphatase
MLAPRAVATAGVALCAPLCPLPAAAQTDFVPPAVPAAAPAGPLVSRGAATTAAILFVSTLLGDQEVREETQEVRNGTTNSLAYVGNAFGDWRLIVPAFSAGYLAGEIAGSTGIKGTALRAAAAVALASGITGGLKLAVGRARPHDASGNLEFHPFSGATSFPSGHTTAAFAIATVLADQTQDSWSDYLLYSAATLTAMARINDQKHWASDVLIGGLIGHFSARWVERKLGPIQVGPTGASVQLPF